MGMAIGIFEDEAYVERNKELKEGDTVFLHLLRIAAAQSIVGMEQYF